ncbi:redoxin family protein [Rapidithrix thailandica]|uniref:Redoxin family protein n=1 Tax=Rapidithrix thailandica TaxID=413964 RepID=A0AAW9SIW7_9BACT
MAIAPSTLAPDFSGVTPEGKKLLLNDLHGKVLFDDVWATWCKPCLNEFTYSKALEKQFEENEELVFFYVSADKKKKAW